MKQNVKREYHTLSILWQKGESQNGGNKNTKHAKFSEKRKTFVFRKIWRALYSCYLPFENRPFAILQTLTDSHIFLVL